MGRGEIRERVRKLVDGYRERTGQPKLSTRELSKQMRESGLVISHGTLQNMLNGTTSPDRSTLQSLCRFFGVSEYYFDADPHPAQLMGRIGTLDERGLEAVERLLNDLEGGR
jgi:transcriptional regulator with XRE-family HTH domain